jgi:hypothetical protein
MISMYLATSFDILTDRAWRKQKSLDSYPPCASAQACAVLSMANWQIRRPAEARHMLAKAEALAPDIAPERGVDKFGGWCTDWPIPRVEISEAKALVQSQLSEEGRHKP